MLLLVVITLVFVPRASIGLVVILICPFSGISKVHFDSANKDIYSLYERPLKWMKRLNFFQLLRIFNT